ncbi:hypothetical protein SEUCBS139899_008183 [Sporothrix eucalyptigena]
MLSLRMAALVVGAYIVAVAATSFPAIVDLNLVFPRNTTYDASALLFMVFAFSNPALLTPLQAQLTYGLYDANDWSAPSWGDQLIHPSTQFHLDTNGTTYLAVKAMPELMNKTGSWLLRWQLDTANCSTTNVGDAGPEAFAETGLGYTSSDVARWVTFSTTTDGSGAQPDLAAAAANATCGAQIATDSGPIIIDVASTYNLSDASILFPDDIFYGDLCAVLVSSSSTPTPSPTPTQPLSCAVNLDAGAIASVSAAATQNACSYFNPPESCIPHTPSSAASRNLGPLAASSFSSQFLTVFGATCMALAIGAIYFCSAHF